MRPKILYAVAGEGRGHAVKSMAIAEKLEKDFDVIFIGGGDAYDLISKTKFKMIEIPCLKLTYRRDSVDMYSTGKYILKLWLKRKRIFKEIEKHIEAIEPVFMISGFEYFVPRVARKVKIPCYQVSHQVLLLICKYRVPESYRQDYWKAWLSSWMIIADLNQAIGVSFFNPLMFGKYRQKKVKIKPPCIRDDLVQGSRLSNCDRKKILIYFSCHTFSWILDELKSIEGEEFIIYGLTSTKALPPHMQIKAISPTSFQDDLLQAKALITNGGHNLIGEAIFLKIPIFCFYIKGQFEQYLNGEYVEKMKYGMRIEDFKTFKSQFELFLENLDHFMTHTEVEDGSYLIAETLKDRYYKNKRIAEKV